MEGKRERGSLVLSRRNGRKGFTGEWYAPRQAGCPKDSTQCLPTSPLPLLPAAVSGRGEASPRRVRGEARPSVSEAMEEMAEPGGGRTGAGAAAMAEGGSERNDGVAGGEAAAASSPPRSPPAAVGGEGGGAKPLSAAEYARRVHQWLWDSYCGYLSWQGCLPALLAASAAASAAGTPRVAAPPPPPSPPPGAAAAYYSPFYLFAPAAAHTAPAGPGPRAAAAAAAAAPPAWPGAAGRLAPLPRAASSSAAGTSGAPRETGRPAGELG